MVCNIWIKMGYFLAKRLAIKWARNAQEIKCKLCLPMEKSSGKLATVNTWIICVMNRAFSMIERGEKGYFLPGKSGNPSGKPAQKFMTEALQMYLLRPSDLPPNKPRNAAEAIAAKMVEKAALGDNEAAKMIYDRMEGKAIQTVKAEIEQKPVDIMDACRRLAFIINSAQALGQPLPPEYALLINPPVSDAELVKVSQEIIENQ